MAKVNLRGGADGLTGATATPLQIRIYSTDATSVPQDGDPELGGTGVISFDMKSQRVGINGAWFGSSNEAFTDLKAIVDKLDGDTGVTGSVAQQILDKVNALDAVVYGADGQTSIVGETAATSAYNGDSTSKVAIKLTETDGKITGIDVKTNDVAKQSDLNSLQTVVTNMRKTFTGGFTGATDTAEHVKVTVALGTSGSEVTVNENDIASATGLAAVKTTADSAIQSVSLTGAGGTEILTKTGTSVTGSIDGSKINVGGTGSHYESSTVSAAIQSLYQSYNSIDKDSFVHSGSLVYGPATNIEGKHASQPSGISTTKTETATDPYIELVIKEHNLTETNETIDAYVYIKATSLVDVYTVPQSQSGPVTLSINDHTISAAFDIASHQATGTATGTAAAATGVSKTSYIQVANSASVTTEDGGVTAVSVGAVSADAAGAANAAYNDAKTDLIGATGDATTADTIHGAKNYAKNYTDTTINSLAGGGTTSVSSTGTASSAASSYKDTVEVLNGVTVSSSKGQVSSVTGTGIQVDKAGAAFKAYNDALTDAKNYADTIISWEVI